MRKAILSVLIICVISFTANAVPCDSVYDRISSNINYVGVVENGFAFDINWDFASKKNVTIWVLDGNNEVLHVETFKDKKSMKRFLVPVGNYGSLTFVVRNGNHSFEKSFQIAVRYTETMEVTEKKPNTGV